MQTLLNVLKRIREVALLLAATKWTEEDCNREIAAHKSEVESTGQCKNWLDLAILVAIRECVTTNPTVIHGAELDILDFMFRFVDKSPTDDDEYSKMDLTEAVEARLKRFMSYRHEPFPGKDGIKYSDSGLGHFYYR